jgi:hypothetical protein
LLSKGLGAQFRALIGRRVRYHLTRGGAIFFGALALTGVIAFISANNLLFLIFAAMLAMLLVSGFLSRLVLAGLEIELLLPQHVAARMPSAARIRIRNLKRFTPSFSIDVNGLRDSSGARPILVKPLYFPLVPGGQTVEAAATVTFPRRGMHGENLFALSTAFPFGFLRKSVNVALRRETIVYPAMEPGPAMEELAEAIAGEGDSPVRGTGRDFYRIRPYEANDSARHVDWKSTAHTGSLQVREFTRDLEPTIEVLLDGAILPGTEPAFERLIEACAFLVWVLADKETPCVFRSGGFRAALENPGAVYDILKFLALTEPVIIRGGVATEATPEVAHEVPGGGFPADESSLQIVFTCRESVSTGRKGAIVVDAKSIGVDVSVSRDGAPGAGHGVPVGQS